MIGDIELDLPAARVGIARLALDWRPARLLEGELHVVALEVTEARVALQEAAEDTAPLDKLPTVALPLRLVVDHLQLSDLVVTPAGADKMVIVDSVLVGVVKLVGKMPEQNGWNSCLQERDMVTTAFERIGFNGPVP